MISLIIFQPPVEPWEYSEAVRLAISKHRASENSWKDSSFPWNSHAGQWQRSEPAKIERNIIFHILMFLFHTSSFQAKERAAESMFREMLGRIFSLHVKTESRESFLWKLKIRLKWQGSIWSNNGLHVYICLSLLREYDGKKYQDGDGDDCSKNQPRFDAVQKCASLCLPAWLLQNKKDNFQQHQRRLEDAQLLIFKGLQGEVKRRMLYCWYC